MATITLEDLNENLEQQNDILNKVAKSSTKMSQGIKGLVDIFESRFGGDDIEAEREQKPQVVPQTNAAGQSTTGGGFDFPGLLAFGAGLLSGLLAAIPAIIAGLVGAVIASFTTFGNDLARSLVSALAFKKIFPRGIPGFATLSKSISDGFKSFSTGLRKAVFSAMFLGEDGKPIAKTFKGIKGAQGAGPLARAMRGVKSLIESVSNVFKPVIDTIKGPAGKLLDTLQPIIKTLGSVLRTIFFPIGVIFTAFDTVKGTIEGYQKEGITGALTGAIGGFLGSIVGAPANLIKAATAFIGEKLGFLSPETKAELDKIDFSKSIRDFFIELPGKVIAAFENIKLKSPEFDISSLNPFAGIAEKIRNTDFSFLNLDKIGFMLGDQFKNLLLGIFEQTPQTATPTGGVGNPILAGGSEISTQSPVTQNLTVDPAIQNAIGGSGTIVDASQTNVNASTQAQVQAISIATTASDQVSPNERAMGGNFAPF